MNTLEIKVSVKNAVTEEQWVELHSKLNAEVHRFLFSLIMTNGVLPTRKELNAYQQPPIQEETSKPRLLTQA